MLNINDQLTVITDIFIDKRFAQVEQIEINVATNDTGEGAIPSIIEVGNSIASD
ncbi:MAG: hypothetical protein ACL7AX_05755 [Candidatus Arsenophonus phytopathogenicus]